MFQAKNSSSCILRSLESTADGRDGMFYVTLFRVFYFLDRIKGSSKYFPNINQKFFSADKLLKTTLPKASIETGGGGGRGRY